MDGRTTTRYCSHCQDVTLFEVPPCEDGHGDDCLDLACVDCGAAVVLGLQEELAVQAAAA